MNDIEIAQNAYLDSIDQIGKKVGLTENELEMYGKYKAKVNVIEKHRLNSKLVLVTAVNPTPAGEGKSGREGHYLSPEQEERLPRYLRGLVRLP